MLRSSHSGFVLRVACAVVALGLAGCKNEPALLLSITADAEVQQYDLYIRDDATQQIVFHSGFNPVLAPGEKSSDGTGSRDLTKDTLKVAVKLSAGGQFTLLVVGVIGDIANGRPAASATQLFWAGRFDVKNATKVEVKLLTVPTGDDADGDLWPDATDFRAHVPAAATLYANSADLLDCDDKINNPPGPNGTPIRIQASSINPFAIEICGDGFDEDCNGNGDEACVDQDKDGDPRGDDCDDTDPARHHPTAADPFPDPPNCCGYSLGKTGTDAGKDFLGDPTLCPKKRCGDGIDESCRGQGPNNPSNDTACVIDADCDGYPADVDCDDNDPAIHPGAPEICGNGKNDSCTFVNGMSIIDAGCVACDLDGDGYERMDAAAGCPDAKNTQPAGVFDCNDYDAQVHPGATSGVGGHEGGAVKGLGNAAVAIKGFCRRIYEPTGLVGTAKIPIPAIPNSTAPAWIPGDVDCNGVAYENCPDPTCDADGDGYPKDDSCGSGPVDCDDNDPTAFPTGIEKCGDGKDNDCNTVIDNGCGGTDADGDGYPSSSDCDDTDKSVHPWATEVCNGRDDDCDFDKDEGNPDLVGAPLILAGAIATCTDNSVGECGKTKGLCVCSAADPKSSIGTTRMACSGDTGQTGDAPHCFGAGQPHPQTCDASNVVDDDCDGDNANANGKDLADAGKACGINHGPCLPGTMIGCNRSQTTSPYFGTTADHTDVEWVCSSNGIYPMAEMCNGIDDDCDGSITKVLDEADDDGDGYIACSGCGTKLATGLLGCGDCMDNDPTVHPGAPEICDGKNNDCAASFVDGSSSCGPTGCCYDDGGGSTCYNLQTTAHYCGMCSNHCDIGSVFYNACGNGACVCGSTGGPCGPGSYCNGNTCSTCNTDTHCGATCGPCAHGCNGGTACNVCSVDSDCSGNNQYCSGGECLTKIANGQPCTVSDPSNPNNVEHSCSGTAYCTDGVCCNQPPSSCGTCKSCNLNGTMGTCANVPNHEDPAGECNANTANCIADYCNGNGACTAGDGTPCGASTCDNSALPSTVTAKVCTGGTCGNSGATACTGDFECEGGSCVTMCNNDSDCNQHGGTVHCNGGTCGGGSPAGSTCAMDSDCTSGACQCANNSCSNKVCCGNTSRPGSCPSAQVCNNGSLTSYVCGGGNNSCTMHSGGNCMGNLGCANGTTCNTTCNDNGDCENGYYCPSGGSASCMQCNTNAQCGTACTACNGVTCNGGTLSNSCNGTSCNGTSMCANHYGCNGNACATTCNMDSDCAGGYWCKSDHSCQPQITGGNCTATDCAQSGCDQCTSGGGSPCNMGHCQ